MCLLPLFFGSMGILWLEVWLRPIIRIKWMFCQYIVVVSVTFTNLCKHLILIVVLKRIERQIVNKMYVQKLGHHCQQIAKKKWKFVYRILRDQWATTNQEHGLLNFLKFSSSNFLVRHTSAKSSPCNHKSGKVLQNLAITDLANAQMRFPWNFDETRPQVV